MAIVRDGGDLKRRNLLQKQGNQDDLSLKIQNEWSRLQKKTPFIPTSITQPVYDLCHYHLVSHDFCNQWIHQISISSEPPESVVQNAFKTIFPYKSISFEHDRKFVFIGPQGCGKTVTLAKIAAMLLESDHSVEVGTLDTVKSGAVEQLQHYTRAMNLNLNHEKTAIQENFLTSSAISFIDTPGTNIRKKEDQSLLSNILESIKACIVLVIPADMNPFQTSNLARAYSMFKPDYIIITKVDTTYQYGTLLNTSSYLSAPLCYYSDSPSIGVPLKSACPESIYRIIQNK